MLNKLHTWAYRLEYTILINVATILSLNLHIFSHSRIQTRTCSCFNLSFYDHYGNRLLFSVTEKCSRYAVNTKRMHITWKASQKYQKAILTYSLNCTTSLSLF